MASILPPGRTVFVDQNGAPLAAGSVTHYVPNTTTLKTTWTDSLETTPNPNPIALDSSGSAVIFGRGAYRQVVRDVLGNTIWDTPTQDGDLAAGIGVSIKSFGATGDGNHDDTAAMIAAVAAAGVGGTILLPQGEFLFSSTIVMLPNQQLIGTGANSTAIVRITDYGDTLIWPAGAAAVRVAGIFFHHLPDYGPTDLALGNKVANGSHIYMNGGQFALIEDCLFWRMTYGIRLSGCTITTIRKNWFNGLWDYTNIACQETIASVFLDSAAPNAIITIENNYFTGFVQTYRPVTYTATDGAKTVTVRDSTGPQFGVLVYACEDLLVTGNFMGSHCYASIEALMQPNTINLEWRIVGNFFDDPPTARSSIYFSTAAGAVALNGVVIEANHFSGEQHGLSAIIAFNAGAPTTPVIINFSITGNTFQAHVGTPIEMYSATNGIISDNNITAWNCLNVSAGADPNFAAAIYIQDATYMEVRDNNLGGLTNAGIPGGYTYQGVVEGGPVPGLNLIRDNNMLGTGPGANQIGLAETRTTTITGGNYQATTYDQFCLAMKTDGQPWYFTLPLNPPEGRTIMLKDGNGQAAAHPVTVVGMIDGGQNATYSVNYFCREFRYNGTQWNVLAAT